MTDPIHDTQPQQPTGTPGAVAGPEADPAAVTGGAAGTGTPGSSPGATAGTDAGAIPGTNPGGAAEPALRVDPNRRSDPGWREPAWIPPRDRHDRRDDRRDRRSGSFAIVVGLILIAIGAWYFLETTLGIDLPTVHWGSIWPIILIALGGLILVRSVQRRS